MDWRETLRPFFTALAIAVWIRLGQLPVDLAGLFANASLLRAPAFPAPTRILTGQSGKKGIIGAIMSITPSTGCSLYIFLNHQKSVPQSIKADSIDFPLPTPHCRRVFSALPYFPPDPYNLRKWLLFISPM